MTDIVLVGGGGHGKVVLAALLRSPDFRVVGYTDPTDHGSPLLGVARLGHDDVLPAVAAEFPGAGAAIGVGMLGSTTVRRRLEAMLDRLGLSLPVIRASSAIVHADVAIGDGTFVGDGVVVNPSARIGRCAILNTRCVVEHDVVVGAHAHIAPGATRCGRVFRGSPAAALALASSVPSRLATLRWLRASATREEPVRCTVVFSKPSFLTRFHSVVA